MADIQIESSAVTYQYADALREGIFWKSTLIGYCIYEDSSYSLKYRKTTDSGQNWSAAQNIRTGLVSVTDCWADWQTPDDAGTKIHITYIDRESDDVRYCYLDTSTDTIGGDTQIEACQGTGSMATTYAFDSYICSITKSVGGNLLVAFRYLDNASAVFQSFYKSADNGATWTAKTTIWESANKDYALLFPGNAVDTQDIWAMFWDISADAVSVKVYDDSGDSWSEVAAVSAIESTTYIQMGGTIQLSDGLLVATIWNQLNNAASDLLVFTYNGTSIVTKTNVITNTAEYAQCSVFIDQSTGDIYVAYLGGTAWESDVHVRYQKSTDGGATWGGEQTLSVTNDDHRWVSAGCMHPTGGGRFMPIWFNDDLDDVMTNYDNSIEIAGVIDQYEVSMTAILSLSATRSDVKPAFLPGILSMAATLGATIPADLPAIISISTGMRRVVSATLPLGLGMLTDIVKTNANWGWLLIPDYRTWKGTWDEDTSYDVGDTVLYRADETEEWHVFVAKAGHNLGNIPDTSAVYWRRLYQERWK